MNEQNQIREWLASLKWDSEPRLDRWLITHAKYLMEYVMETGNDDDDNDH